MHFKRLFERLRLSNLQPAICNLHTAHCTLHPAHCTLQLANCKLQTANCKLPTAHCTLHPANCKLQTANCKLPTANCTLPTANCKLQTANCTLQTVLALFAALAVNTSSAAVEVTQELTLKRGWNAVYVEVAPTEALDDVFASWPVTSVAFYDPASFLSTRQFSGMWDSEGLSASAMAMWHRDFPEATNVKSIPAGTVCLAFNTNSTKTAVQVKGVPAAPRITWHVTNTNDVYNYIGFSLQDGASILPSAYMDGFEGTRLKSGFYSIAGNYATNAPSITPIYSTTKVTDGSVLLVASDKQSDWPGVLEVSPMNGLDFGTDTAKAALTIENKGSTTRTVSVQMLFDSSWCDDDVVFAKTNVYFRDATTASNASAWTNLTAISTDVFTTKELEAGDEWKLEIGLDRKALDVGVKGRSFGSLIRITEDGSSQMRVDVPLVGETSGGTAIDKAWPGGLWIAEATLNRIMSPDRQDVTETGGSVQLRLPIHIDANGTVRLLQRVVAAGETDSDGNFNYLLYGGNAEIPATAKQVMRISAVTLPTETPVIAAAASSFATGGVSFEFTVAADGATSLLRHPLHPQHDGLRWDFTTAAPSGDTFANYKGDVKPETFSVENKIYLTLDVNGTEAAWNPEDTKTGTCAWVLTGLMRQGPIMLLGDMTIKRISPVTHLVLE